MDLFANVTPFSAALAVVAGIIFLAAALALEVPGLVDKPESIKPTLYAYFAAGLFIASIAGWLAFQLGFSVCQPIPAATIDSVLNRLNHPATEAAK